MENKYEEILKQGLSKVSQKKYSESKSFFEKLIKINKKRYEGYLNLSNILVIENKITDANKILKEYLTKINSNSEIVNGLAINLYNSNNNDELNKHVDLYLKNFDNYLLNFLKGHCLNFFDDNINVEIYLKKSISLNSKFWPAYELLFQVYDQQNSLIEMNELLKKSNNFFPNNLKLSYFEALYNFKKHNFKICNEILNSKSLIEHFNKNENPTFLSNYYNLLSKNFEKLLDYKNCLNYALKRNKILINSKKNKDFNKKELLDTINSYIKFFDKSNKKLFKSNSIGLGHSNLTFLIGFPRSGTTLLDSILRSHSKTLVLEEKPYLLNLRHEFIKKNKISKLLELDEKQKIEIQENYFESFNYSSDRIIIDKFPLNLIELGFIKTIFPNAKIILAIRHPLDCIISCVLTAFKMNEAMLNFENLQTTTFFYNQVFTLLIKYIKFFNIKLHQIKYEDVVLDFDNKINKLLSFLSLEFENNIYSFYDTAKRRGKINTPSYDQVIKPLYSNSINRHLKFNEISTISKDVEKWINYYSYNKANF